MENNNEKKKGSCLLNGLLMIAFGLILGITAALSFVTVKFVSDRVFVPVANMIFPDNSIVSGEFVTDNPKTNIEDAQSAGEDGASADVEDMIAEKVDGYSVMDIVEMCMPSIVSITVKVDYDYYGYTVEGEGAGSGIIVGESDTELLIATNYHVIEDGKEITIQFCDGFEAPATVKGKKVSMDLAVVAVKLSDINQDTKEAIVIATIGDSDSLQVGEGVVAIGNALGYGQSVTTGVVSALNREIVTGAGETAVLLQTDAAINPGNSGGALINMKGELIGINSNKLEGTAVEGMGYAIPINEADPIIRNLMNKKDLDALPEDQQSSLGISGIDVTSSMTSNSSYNIPIGIYIQDVMDGGTADLAGLKRGDIITEFEGDSVISMKELKQYLAAYAEGSQVTITFERFDGTQYVEHSVTCTLQNKSAID